ncbi:MAG: Xaa-Pro peptidase family protein [Coriobacteriales bacterium]|jgi:Xaa-Pro aminopeptidase|nr:Xaa-Pro peptidase family protein [Coriobacteriales bacterium]
MSINERLHRLDNVMTDQNLDAYLATNTSDIRWLTGFSHVFDSEQAHAMLVSSSLLTNDPLRLLHTDMRYSGAMRQQNDGTLDVLDDERKPHSQFVIEQFTALATSKYRDKTLRIGIETDLSLAVFRSLTKALDESELGAYELVELPGYIQALRAVKDLDEIQALKNAQQITDAGFIHMLEFLKPGQSEAEVAVELEFFIRRIGSEDVSFSAIIGSGPNSAIPHAIPGKRQLERGDFVVMDFGAKLDDYRSDMTRTVVIGSASEYQREIYATVLTAQLAALVMISPGVKMVVPYDKVNAIFAEHGFEPLTHGLGHGVGIDIHEAPTMALKSEGELVVGHVVTVEPGIYIEGFGGVRIEDYGAVTESGFDNFTTSAKELVEL